MESVALFCDWGYLHLKDEVVDRKVSCAAELTVTATTVVTVTVTFDFLICKTFSSFV